MLPKRERARSSTARVVGTATSADGAQAISERLAATSGRGEVVDVADQTSVAALFSRLEADGLVPGIVVNNAGITRDNLLARMKDEEWDSVIETDLTSLFRVCRAAARCSTS